MTSSVLRSSIVLETHELCCHRAFLVTQRGIILHNALFDQVIELGDVRAVYLNPSEAHTANRYPLSPILSRYRRQNGRVPKFLLIVARSCFAVCTLNFPGSVHTYLTGKLKFDSPKRNFLIVEFYFGVVRTFALRQEMMS